MSYPDGPSGYTYPLSLESDRAQSAQDVTSSASAVVENLDDKEGPGSRSASHRRPEKTVSTKSKVAHKSKATPSSRKSQVKQSLETGAPRVKTPTAKHTTTQASSAPIEIDDNISEDSFDTFSKPHQRSRLAQSTQTSAVTADSQDGSPGYTDESSSAYPSVVTPPDPPGWDLHDLISGLGEGGDDMRDDSLLYGRPDDPELDHIDTIEVSAKKNELPKPVKKAKKQKRHRADDLPKDMVEVIIPSPKKKNKGKRPRASSESSEASSDFDQFRNKSSDTRRELSSSHPSSSRLSAPDPSSNRERISRGIPVIQPDASLRPLSAIISKTGEILFEEYLSTAPWSNRIFRVIPADRFLFVKWDSEPKFEEVTDRLWKGIEFVETTGERRLRRFVFLGTTESRLKENGVIYFEEGSDWTVKQILFETFGDLKDVWKSSGVGKFIARLSLNFSPTTPTIHVDAGEFAVVDDIYAPDGKPYTDGCGCITEEAAFEVSKMLRLDYVPSGELSGSSNAWYKADLILTLLISQSFKSVIKEPRGFW